jgi:hypothetical protein
MGVDVCAGGAEKLIQSNGKTIKIWLFRKDMTELI